MIRRTRALAAAAVTLGVLAAPAEAAAPPATAQALVTDNAFRRGGVDRPTVTLRAGGVMTWRWRAQQSHSVAVRSGPERFTSPTKTRGTYARRLRRAGTYRIVCLLHAPGMVMTVRVVGRAR